MEVVEAHQIRLEAVLDAIDMKTFGLMAAIGKIELDNFRERSTMGKRGLPSRDGCPPAVSPMVTASETTEGPRWLRSKPRSFDASSACTSMRG